MNTNSDKEKQIDLFPVSKKEQNKLEKYVSSKQIAFNEAEEEKAREQRAREEIEDENGTMYLDLKGKIYDYIETNKFKILSPVFKIQDHKKPLDQERGFIHLCITPPKFVKPKKTQTLSKKEQDLCRFHFINLSKDDPITLDDLALHWYGDFFELDLEVGFMGWGEMGLTRLIGGIEKKVVKTWKYKKEHGREGEDLIPLEGPHDTYAFYDESYYRHDYIGDHNWALYKNYEIYYEWTYPWYFTVFEDSIVEAGEKFFKYFLDNGPEYHY